MEVSRILCDNHQRLLPLGHHLFTIRFLECAIKRMHYHYYFSCNTYYKRDVPVDFLFHIPFFIIRKGNINYCFWDFLGQKQPDGILNFSELSELSWSSENY